ncbi:MAG: sensor histidine kinase [Gemmataceae bacterium]
MSGTPRGVEAGANLTIIKKGLILVAIPLLAQLVFLGVLFKMRQDQLQAQKFAIHSKDVIAQTEGAFRVVMESRSAVRSLALTGDPTFVSAWKNSRSDAVVQLRVLRELVADNPPQQEKIDRIIQQIEEVFAQLETIAQLAQRPETRDKAIAVLKEPWALRLLEDLRRKVNAFLQQEERLNAERRARLESAGREQAWTLVGGAMLAVLSTAVLAYLFSRGIASRLAVLIDNTRRLAAGEALAAPLAGRDDLSRLDRVFHEMAYTLIQKDRENEMFVYSVSHDLRSPLVNLQGFSQELALVCEDLRRIVADNELPAAVRARLTTLIDRDAGESIHFIQTAVRRLAAIIDALLRLSRVGRVVYDWQPIDVRVAVERVVKALGNTITQKGARVVVGELPPAWSDPTAIEQIFANLLGNALNYLDPSRRGIIEVGSREPEGNGQGHTYYVKDNGLGIDADHLPKIFLAFQRLHPMAAPGEGIGLPLVRRVVERHGGRIWVESVVGEGSTFFLTLPASDRGGAEPNGQASADGRTSEEKFTELGEITTWPRSRST